MFSDNMLLKIENTKFAICLVTDDHKTHLKSHIWYSYKLRIIKHIFDHLYLWYYANKMGIPTITLNDVLRSVRGLNEKK